MSYWFISHSSSDNKRIAPVVEALLESDVPLWFDRPYDLGLPTHLFVGYIREGEPWTIEILGALIRSCGIVCFPSDAAQSSDECRLEIALGRTFATVISFRIVPILLDESSWRHLDPRIAQTQGRRISVTPPEAEDKQWSLATGADHRIRELSVALKQHLLSFGDHGDVLTKLHGHFAAAAKGLSGLHPPSLRSEVHTGTAAGSIQEIANAYRQAVSPEARSVLDEKVLNASNSVSITQLTEALHTSPDEAMQLAISVLLARAARGENVDALRDTAVSLLGSSSERVRYRAARALKIRSEARLVESTERNGLTAVLEAALALERSAQVKLALASARDQTAGHR